MKHLTPQIIKGKRVLMRVDFNVDVDEKGKVIDDFRIQRTLPTLKFLQESRAEKIILISHLGQPEKNDFWTEKFTLKPIADYLEKILKEKIYFCSLKDFKEIKEVIDKSEKGAIWLLENIRYHEGENTNDKNLAQQLSQLGDIYINEAFSVSHREAASLCAITEFLPSYPGLLFQEEIEHLNKIIKNSEPPTVMILGGAKMTDKIPVIEKFFNLANFILIGGAIANTILKSWNFEIGNSLFEEEMIEKAKNLGSDKAELILPGDFLVLTKKQQKNKRELGKIEKEDTILDIGPVAASTFQRIISQARTIFWNGPMGRIEDERFSEGTKIIIEAILSNAKARTLIGGGDTLMSIKLLKPEYRIPAYAGRQNTENRFFSTGGGAMLKYLAGENLPALRALENSKL